MAILAKIRNGIKGAVTKAAAKTADGIAKVSQMSPEQVRAMDDKRISYLSQMPSSDDALAQELTRRNLGAISIEVNEAYLPQISKLYLPIAETNRFAALDRISYFRIAKWAKDSTENNLEKLMNVYQVLSEEPCNIALIYHRTQEACSIYMAIVNNKAENDHSEVANYKRRLVNALRGNFPGAQLDGISEHEQKHYAGVPACLQFDSNADSKKVRSVAIVSNLATEKTEKFASQTIEKLLDGVVPENSAQEYAIVLLATPIQDSAAKKDRLYELHSALTPYAAWQTNYQVSESDMQGSSASVSVNLGASAGNQTGTSNSVANSTSETNTYGENEGMSTTTGTSSNSGSNTRTSRKSSSSKSKSTSKSETLSRSISKSIANTIGNTITSGANIATSFGFNAGASFARSSNTSITVGKNEGITQSFANYGIKHTMELLEKQVERIEQSEALGLWDFAAYIISEDSVIANNVAHTYLALTQGEESFLSESAVNLWRGDLPETSDKDGAIKGQANAILASLSRLQHPEFCLSDKVLSEKELEDYMMYPCAVSATVSLSGKELSRALNFPSRSVSGVPVIETAAFGRNAASYHKLQQDFELGSAYHMHISESHKLSLERNSLTSHLFVTGSTGTGKTNTVATLLKRLALEDGEREPHFMVIEPAKGEYKSLLGGYENVSVYGTNPRLSKLLRIDPFSFPQNIAVNEHIDRLVEIFNVCWPMYAAMPAILKDAVIRAYESAGWDMDTSENKYTLPPYSFAAPLYPTFTDVMEQVRAIMKSSEYSDDSKGDYTGALVARLKSLTIGINGQLFSGEALDDGKLFEANVIVDLSRVGATETKSLIMGLLVLKLQEYCLSEKTPDHRELRHIMVLEEAHNLLRRTSTEQSSETANLLGKSVEMLTNAIAELRAFGEGFIIADQAPGLLDPAVIRNTNTKIIHRLPEQSDRELVGKSVGLTDAQIAELARLEMGVAAVYQNNWIEAVLCQVDEFQEKYPADPETDTGSGNAAQLRSKLVDYLMREELVRKDDKADLLPLAKQITRTQLSLSVKTTLLDYIYANNASRLDSLRKLLYEITNAYEVFEDISPEDSLDDMNSRVTEALRPSIRNYPREQINMALALLLLEQSERDRAFVRLLQEYCESDRGGHELK